MRIESNVRLGIAIANVQKMYYYKDLIAFLKDGNPQGNIYFYELKPLFDKYGYEKVISTLLELDKEEQTDE